MSEHALEGESVRVCVILHVGVSVHVDCVSVHGVVSAYVDMNLQGRVCYTVLDLVYLP